jgi:PAS domain S-box-containing protein
MALSRLNLDEPDISEQAQIEARLRESEERYRDLVEHSHDLICTHDLEGRILSVNRTAARVLGYEPDDVIGKNIRDILAPEVRHEFKAYIAALRTNGEAKGLMLIQTGAGERRIWEYHNTLRREGGATPMVRGIAHDITELKQAERALKQRNRQLSVLNQLSLAVSRSLNIKEIMAILAEQVVEQMDFKIAFVTEYIERERMARLLSIYPRNALTFEAVKLLGLSLDHLMVPFRGEENAVYAQLLHGRDWVGDDFAEIATPTVPRLVARAAQKLYGVRSIHNLPIMSAGRLVGTLAVGSERETISDEERQTLLAAAAQVAPALENARLYEEARKDALHRTSLVEVTSAINSTVRMDELLELIVEKVLQLTGSRHGSLFLLNDADDTLTIRASRGVPEETIRLGRFKRGEGIVGWVAETGQGVLIGDAEADPHFKPLPQAERFTSLINVPMLVEGRVVGVLSVDRLRGERPFTDAEFRIVQDFAGQAALALVKARLFEALERELAERKQAESALKHSQEQLRALSFHLQSVREEERTLIAREIHDELAQVLTALKMDCSWVDSRVPQSPELRQKLESMSQLIDQTVTTVHRISSQLRPGLLDNLGLIAAIEWQAQEFQERTGIECDLRLPADDLVLDEERATAIFRIFQETLTNVARHAQATRVKIKLIEKVGKLVLRVSDNGRGIPPEQITDPMSLGLIGIRERVYPWGGAVKIKGMRDRGTTVSVTLPLD